MGRKGADGHRRVTLTLDRVKVISICTIHIGLPAHPTMWLYRHSSSNTEIKLCNIHILRSLKSHDSLLRWKFKNWAPTSCRVGPYYQNRPSVLSARQNGKGDKHRKVQFSELQKLNDLDLDLGSGQSHTGVHIQSSRGLPTHQIISKSEKLFMDGWTYVRNYVRMDGWRDTPELQSVWWWPKN